MLQSLLLACLLIYCTAPPVPNIEDRDGEGEVGSRTLPKTTLTVRLNAAEALEIPLFARTALLHRNSSDNFENRKRVREILAQLTQYILCNSIKSNLTGRARPPPIPKPDDLGPRSNFMDLTPETNPEFSKYMYEGDIMLTPDQAKDIIQRQIASGADRKKRGIQTTSTGFWSPNNPINYTFDSSLPSSFVQLIRTGIQYWTTHTCLNFRENANGNNRLNFIYGSGCWSYVGRQPTWQSQEISIGPGCNNLGTVTHEIGHALGFYHTQSSFDRDSYIYINNQNIDPQEQYNFAKLTKDVDNTFNLPYDYGSVMHYGGYAFAVNVSVYTIQTLNPAYQNTIGQREQPAFSDVRLMNYAYNCSSFCVNIPVPACRAPGYPNPRKCNQCLCPQMFGGPTCNQLPAGDAPNCNGKVVQATSTSWTTLNGIAGNPNSYSTTEQPTNCFWHISAPAGRRIQVKLSSPPSNCVQGCVWQGIEINLGQFDIRGIIVCCPSTRTYTSTGNLVALRGIIRYNQLRFGLDYRLV